VFASIRRTQKLSFLDYIYTAKVQLNLITAIDFTGSNGEVYNASSLHHVSDKTRNEYEICIEEVGSRVCPYDSDQQFPVYGFGCQVDGEVNHAFALTLDPENPSVTGLQGILDAYHNALRSPFVKLSGPTLFEPIIRLAAQQSLAAWAADRTYTILLILTDGTIQDMQRTIETIVEVSDHPLSILIVGVGPADFASMKILDGDQVRLRARNGGLAKRDIVNFVQFAVWKNNPEELGSVLLEEIPAQVSDFCESHKVPAVRD
jgi:hypothetical protein